MTFRIVRADMRRVLRFMAPESVDALVCDPPYELGFMGKRWDRAGVAFDPATWAAGLRVLKPGGRLLAFGAPRTAHRIWCAIEDAGFVIEDTVAWMFGSGMPKSWNLRRAEADVLPEAVRCGCDRSAHPATSLRDAFPTGHQARPRRGSPPSARGATRTVGGSQSGCPESLRSDDARPLPGEAGGQGVAPSPACAPERTHSPAPSIEGPAGSAPSRNPSAVPRTDHRPTPGSVLPASSPLAAEQRPACEGASSPEGDLRTLSSSMAGSASAPASRADDRSGRHTPRTRNSVSGLPRDVLLYVEELQDESAPIIPFIQVCGNCGHLRFGEGFGSCLKPAYEPCVMARKPFAGTILQNVLTYGTGVLNIDAARIGGGWSNPSAGQGAGYDAHNKPGRKYGNGLGGIVADAHPAGRWPPNVAMDEEAARVLDEMSGEMRARGNLSPTKRRQSDGVWGANGSRFGIGPDGPTDAGDSGGASRFLYVAKASRAERETGLEDHARTPGGSNAKGFTDDVARGLDRNRPVANPHPTVKPVALMRWLVRLVTEPGDLVLDPFAGSGTTGIACMLEGRRFVGVEMDPAYAEIARKRIGAWKRYAVPDEAKDTACPETLDLFGNGSRGRKEEG